ncbi:hypothetical protein PAMA_005611 [Pampus argenteus]
MAGSSNTSLSRDSSPTDPAFHSAPNSASSLRLPAACLSGAFLSGAAAGGGSGRVPVGVNGAPPHAECDMVEVHGVKVASFTVNGVELICLPQVFELFLKHLVGGLHTVYTKLKRLDISPVVCTVEQVRVLRGLGAIQPGVNRCKLITRADFETLYRDCTNASSRPGRPPKRTLGLATMTDGSRLLPHGLLSPALLSQTGLSAAAMAEAIKLQKMRMMMGFHLNGNQHRQHNGTESENDDTGGSEASSSVAAPPAGSALLHINTLQQHNALLANRELCSDWINKMIIVSLTLKHLVTLTYFLLRSVRASFYGHAPPPPPCGPAPCQHRHGNEPDKSTEWFGNHGRHVAGSNRRQQGVSCRKPLTQ